MNIFRIAINSPLRRNFDYLPPENFDCSKLKRGVRVRVPFGKREIIGFFLECDTKSQVEFAKLKHVIEIIDLESVFTESIFDLCVWASNYYHHPLGEVLFSALPKALREGKEIKPQDFKDLKLAGKEKHDLALNTDQKDAVNKIISIIDKASTFLLDGITGSGKTEVYLRVISEVIKKNKQALVLVPEINLTPQTLTRFKARFPKENIVLFHSRMTDRERFLVWQDTRLGLASIIIGTRSALFTSLLNPGVIVLDEEHDLSFKQQAGFRYSARDLAVVRSKLENIPLILGSATPSLESYQNALTGRYIHLSLKERVGGATHPEFSLIDLRKTRLRSGLTETVISSIQNCLDKNEQVLIFINRRGYSPSLICHHCGFAACCTKCDVKLTLHQKEGVLRCHHCGSSYKILTTCPKCGGQDMLPSGFGTERLETGLTKLFPGINLIRVDSDSTRKKGSMDKILEEIVTGESKILIGTQMLTKGHHFPDVTLVVIVNADSGLYSSDFRASEYLSQLIIQVAGRAGRALKPGKILIQTHNPEHHLLQNLIRDGYPGFVTSVLEERKEAFLPPFGYIALIRSEGKTRTLVHDFLGLLRDYGISLKIPNIHLLGPIPATIERKRNNYNAELLIQSSDRVALHKLLPSLLNFIEKSPLTKRIKWSLDVDPVEV